MPKTESKLFQRCQLVRVFSSVCDKVPCQAESVKTVSKSSVRKYILLTFSHVEKTPERQALSVEIIISRLVKTFVCESIIVSKECHSSLGGIHYHVGIRNSTASKHTAVSILLQEFWEFEGCQCNVSFHKGWNTICKYLLKEDKSPTVKNL